MILTGKEIARQVRLGNIEIENFDKRNICPNSYNLRLGNQIAWYDDYVLDMKKNNPITTIQIPEEGFILRPGIVYLASTVRTSTKEFAPMIEGRSSVGRLGLFVHITAGFGDVGFNGRWTLELACIQPVRIYAGVEICQIFFHELTGEKTFYGEGSKYQNADGIQQSLLYKDFEK